jgi:molybdopterin converting factor subunit 1
MQVTVLLFASYADALGRSSMEMSLPPGATVRDVIDRLASVPGAERLPESPLVAVNQSYATLRQALAAGDEVAVIPPVAGG